MLNVPYMFASNKFTDCNLISDILEAQMNKYVN